MNKVVISGTFRERPQIKFSKKIPVALFSVNSRDVNTACFALGGIAAKLSKLPCEVEEVKVTGELKNHTYYDINDAKHKVSYVFCQELQAENYEICMSEQEKRKADELLTEYLDEGYSPVDICGNYI